MPTKAEAERNRIVDAFIGRLATTPIRDIELADVAADAGVSLAAVRAGFDDRLAILDAFRRRIDGVVLGHGDPVEGSSGRDRLFDVLMRRFDALAPYRDAVRMLVASMRRDPLLALALNRATAGSMAFMLAAARIPTAGPMGRLRTQGLVLAHGRILPVFVADDDPGLAKTMVAVDMELARGERLLGVAERVCSAVKRADDRLRRRRPARPAADDGMAGEGI